MENDKITVRVKNGFLVATPSTDPNYPGIDVEFVADTDTGAGANMSRPRVLIEQPINEDGNYETLRAIVWNNKHSEDYSNSIDFAE